MASKQALKFCIGCLGVSGDLPGAEYWAKLRELETEGFVTISGIERHRTVEVTEAGIIRARQEQNNSKGFCSSCRENEDLEFRRCPHCINLPDRTSEQEGLRHYYKVTLLNSNYVNLDRDLIRFEARKLEALGFVTISAEQGPHHMLYHVNITDAGVIQARHNQSTTRGYCSDCEDLNTLPPQVDQEWQREIAMEAGMLGGCEAYNDAMGY